MRQGVQAEEPDWEFKEARQKRDCGKDLEDIVVQERESVGEDLRGRCEVILDKAGKGESHGGQKRNEEVGWLVKTWNHGSLRKNETQRENRCI